MASPRIGAALRARCPVCGSGGIWKSYGQNVERCPGCDYKFEREEGYWVGALIVNMAFAMGMFVLVFVVPMVLFWPDVPWTGLLIANVIAVGLVPIVLYPQSKTLWIWLDLKLHPYRGDERDWERPKPSAS